MRVLVTRASGYIGSVVVPDLVAAGHDVVGLARSDTSAAAVRLMGAKAVYATLEDLDSLQKAASSVDAVVHLAYRHDIAFAGRYDEAVASDVAAIEALASGLPSGGAITIAGGILGLEQDGIRPADEHSRPAAGGVGEARQPSTDATLALADRGLRSSVVRLAPTVHGEGDALFVAMLIELARSRSFSGYPGDGSARQPAVHLRDAARLFRLAVERAPAGAVLHGVAEEGIAVRDIAGAIGRRLGVPTKSVPVTELDEHFGFVGMFLDIDGPASSDLTRRLTGWEPRECSLLEDLDLEHYFRADD